MDRAEVVKILTAHGVEEFNPSRKRSLTLKRVLLRGTKHDGEKPFEFLWDDLATDMGAPHG